MARESDIALAELLRKMSKERNFDTDSLSEVRGLLTNQSKLIEEEWDQRSLEAQNRADALIAHINENKIAQIHQIDAMFSAFKALNEVLINKIDLSITALGRETILDLLPKSTTSNEPEPKQIGKTVMSGRMSSASPTNVTESLHE